MSAPKYILLSLFVIFYFSSCQSRYELKNGNLLLSVDDNIPQEWILESGVVKNNLKKEFESGFHYSNSNSGSFNISQELELDSGDYLLFAKINTDIKSGSFYIEFGNKRTDFWGIESTCDRVQLTLHSKKPGYQNISFGIDNQMTGSFSIDSVWIYKTSYIIPTGRKHEIIKKTLENQSDNYNKLSDSIDELIENLALKINIAMLQPVSEIGQSLLSEYSSLEFETESTRFINTFTKNPNDKSAYCQKVSLSLDNLVRTFGIPTRQLHWQKDCSGIHQFMEYYDKNTQSWKIIDPYFGIRYIDNNGRYLGFEEVEKLVRLNKFSENNIEKVNSGRLYYNLEEILDGWYNHDLAIHVNNW